MSTSQLSGRRLVTFAAAPAAGANTGCLLEVGAAAPYALFYDNGSALVPIDLQGDWAGRTVTDADAVAATNDNVVYMNSAVAHNFTLNTMPAQPLNKLIEVVPIGTGTVTIVAGSGVTITGALTSRGQGKPISLIQRSLNTWVAIGGNDAVFFSGTAGGTQASIYNGAQAFNTVTVTDNIVNIGGGTYSGGIYTIPAGQGGIYHIIASLRIGDSVGPFNVGVGVDTANTDTPNFYWDTNPNPSTGTNRKTFQYNSKRSFAAGAGLRLFSYSDTNSNPAFWAAALSIHKVG